MEHWTEYMRFFTPLLVILDPFAVIPIFLGLTARYSEAEKRNVMRTATLTVAVVLVVTAHAGEALLGWLGTSLAAFRVDGGIVLFMMAWAMLQAQVDRVRTSPSEAQSASGKASVAVVPIAIPLLGGAGAMSTVIITMHRSQAAYHLLMVTAVILIVVLVLWVAPRMAKPIGDLLGEIGMNILNRVFGLSLAAIAVEVVANGIKQLFPVLSN